MSRLFLNFFLGWRMGQRDKNWMEHTENEAKDGGREGIRGVKGWITMGRIVMWSTVRKEGKGTISAQVKETVFVAYWREGREEWEEIQPSRMWTLPLTAMGGEMVNSALQCFQVVKGSSFKGFRRVQKEGCDMRLGRTQHAHMNQSTPCTLMSYSLWMPHGK